MTVIADWLDVTYSPLSAPEQAVLDVLQQAGAECINSDNNGASWRVGSGVFKLQWKATFHRYSASGAVLEHLRLTGLYMDYLSALADAPHAVTRLDAAHDVLTDAAPIIAKLRRRYPHECNLSRKALRTKSILEAREDGKESGTWYVGHKSKGRITARVYDKSLQMLNVHGVVIPECTRYELTFKKDMGPTLRDAAEPERIFWHHATPLLLKRPQDVSSWQSGWGGGWNYQRPETPLAGVLKARIESSAELAALAELADRADCADYCIALIERVLRRNISNANAERALKAS
jgi:hypothetical protein